MAITTITSGINTEKGITYTHITDTSADWASLANDTYFYNLEDDLPYYKNTSGTVIAVFEEPAGNTIYTGDDSLTGNRILNMGLNQSLSVIGVNSDFIVGNTVTLGCEQISLQYDTLINGELVLQANGTPVTDGCHINNSYSFYIDGGELKGRYKDNLGVVTDLTIGSVPFGLMSVNDANGEPTYYSDLQTAVNAAGAGGVVYLHSDITQTTEVTLPAGANIDFTINGNGHKITHTSNTGSEYSLFFVGNGNNKKFFLNNIRIESNGTSTSNSTGAVFRANPGGGTFKLFFDDNTYIKSINNAIVYLSDCTGGHLESENSYVNFGSSVVTVENAQVTTKFGRSNFKNCGITVNTGGQIGSVSVEITNCTITGDADTSDMINIKRNCKFWNNTVICNSGGNSAFSTDSGTPGNFINIYGCKIYHYGTGTALRGTYISDIHNCYIYAESNIALYVLRTDNGHTRYNIKDVTCVTNSTSSAAFYDQQGSTIDAFRIKGLTAICKNALNTSSAMLIQVRASDGPMYMTDCEAVVFNPSVKNITFSDSGTVYMYNVLTSEVGTGVDFGTVTLGNTNALDSYGNGQIG